MSLLLLFRPARTTTDTHDYAQTHVAWPTKKAVKKPKKRVKVKEIEKTIEELRAPELPRETTKEPEKQANQLMLYIEELSVWVAELRAEKARERRIAAAELERAKLEALHDRLREAIRLDEEENDELQLIMMTVFD